MKETATALFVAELPVGARRQCCLAGLALLALALGGAVGEAAVAAALKSPEQGLCLYIPFENSAQPSFCRGVADAKMVAGFIGEGRVGHGAVIVGNASISLPAPGNFHRGGGTVAFWHKPQWTPTNSGEASPVLLAEKNFQLIWSPSRRVFFFMTGSAKLGIGFRWDYSTSAQLPPAWTPNVWHHFALTWDRATGAKALFVDGRKLAQGKTEWIRDGEPEMDQRITLGSPTAPGLYDEWLIWDRVLEEAEIAALHAQPEVAAKVYAALKPPTEEARPPVEFDLVRLEPRGTIVEPDEVFHLPTTAHNRTQETLQLRLRLSLVDVFDRVLERRTQDLSLSPGGSAPLAFDLQAKANGVFKLRAESEWKGQAFRADLGGFAVWPKGKLSPSVDSFFGHHVNAWGDGMFIKQAARLGFSWVRDHDMLQATWWTRVQPEPGEPQWSNDFQLEPCQQAGLFVLGEFFGTPYWAADPPQKRPSGNQAYPTGAKPRMDAFENYVQMTVAHFRGKIRVWEVWNEPDVSLFWTGTPEEYAQLAQVACRAAKAADPSCTVFVGAIASDLPREWMERCAKAGAFSQADGISFHGYCQSLSERLAQLDIVRSVIVPFAPAGKTLPIWDTEWGFTDTTFYVDGAFPGLPSRRLLPTPSYLEGTAEVPKLEAVSMAQGIGRSFYYLHNGVSGPGAYSNFAILEPTQTPRPKLISRLALEFLTRGASAPHYLAPDLRRHLAAVVYSTPDGGSLALVWTDQKAPAKANAVWPKDSRVFDVFANPISFTTGEPIAFSSVPVYVRAACASGQLSKILTEAELAR